MENNNKPKAAEGKPLEIDPCVGYIEIAISKELIYYGVIEGNPAINEIIPAKIIRIYYGDK